MMKRNYTLVELVVTITVGVALALLMTQAFSGSVVSSSVAPMERLYQQIAVRDVLEYADALWAQERRGLSPQTFYRMVIAFAESRDRRLNVAFSEPAFSVVGNLLVDESGGAFAACRLDVSYSMRTHREKLFRVTRIFFK